VTGGGGGWPALRAGRQQEDPLWVWWLVITALMPLLQQAFGSP
jgi:hypothetical protein